MDDMAMIRKLLAEPPPARRVVEKGRERLLGAQSPAPGAMPPRRRVAFRSVTGLGLAGAALVAALIVAALWPVSGRAPRGGTRDQTHKPARNVLLAAAARAESAPTTGTYWHVRTMSKSTLPEKLGSGDNHYTVESLSLREDWATRDGQTWWGSREWGRPKTPEDEAAWRRDGAPSKWCAGTTDTEPPRPICLHIAPGTASLVKGKDGFAVSEGRELTFAQLQRLPGSPDALRTWVLDGVKDDLDPSASAAILDENVAAVVSNLLVDVPVPPDVRAAAYRVLADMPNVTSTGSTQDELGREGIGIEIGYPADEFGVAVVSEHGVLGCTNGDGCSPNAGELTHTLIIDPHTSYVLATQMRLSEASDPFHASLILEVGWTDETPHEPELP
jgi:hypothetical protein